MMSASLREDLMPFSSISELDMLEGCKLESIAARARSRVGAAIEACNSQDWTSSKTRHGGFMYRAQ
jgi:hypothetical protein